MDEPLDLPQRMFAAREKPVGIRVTSYGHSSGIQNIMDALNEEEQNIIRQSTFGKFVSIADNPAYSGRFGRFLISRQLNVNKKHEIWVLYDGHPIRFSLKEFAIITGLPCGKFPKKSRKRLSDNISETPYWPSLFGKLETVSVAAVVKMFGLTDAEVGKIAELVVEKMKGETKRLEGKVEDNYVVLGELNYAVNALKCRLRGVVGQEICDMKKSVIDSILGFLDKSTNSEGVKMGTKCRSKSNVVGLKQVCTSASSSHYSQNQDAIGNGHVEEAFVAESGEAVCREVGNVVLRCKSKRSKRG